MPLSTERIRKVVNENQALFIALEDLDRTGKLKKIDYKKRYNFTIDQDVMNRFRSYCSKNGIVMSNKIEELIKNFISHPN